ncbi:MAG TPA: hypothetical protein VKP10_12045, partial [Gemmatimonadales bacterium]|nr:hypothetical protein [Gemmatimonadales bacterium]
WGTSSPTRHPALLRVTQRVALDQLRRLAGDPDATPEARAAAEWGLRRIARTLARAPAAADAETQAHRELAAADIERYLSRRDEPTKAPVSPPAPPLAPIGERH